MTSTETLRTEFATLRTTARGIVGARFDDMLAAAFADVTNDGECFAEDGGPSHAEMYVAAVKLVIERGQKAQGKAPARRDWFLNMMSDSLAVAAGRA